MKSGNRHRKCPVSLGMLGWVTGEISGGEGGGSGPVLLTHFWEELIWRRERNI